MRLPLIFAVFALLFVPPLVAQEAEQEGNDPKLQGIYFRYAIFLPGPFEGDMEKRAHELLREKYSNHLSFKAPVAKLNQGSHVTFQTEQSTVYPPPAVEYLQFKGFGISEEQAKKIQESPQLFLIDFFIVRPKNYDYLLVANRFAYELAEIFDELLWDDETKELFAPMMWRSKRLNLDIDPAVANSTLHGYPVRTGGYCAVTIGLRKLGQPDVVITGFPEAYWKPISTLMEFLIEQLSQDGPLSPKESFTPSEIRSALNLDETTEVPAINLIEVEIEEGDTKNRMLSVDFTPYPGKDVVEQQAFLIQSLMRPSDDVLAVIGNQELLMEASQAAIEKLKEKKPLVNEGLPEGERLLVKAFLHDEYLWVLIHEWEGDTLKGILNIEPVMTDQVKAGDAIEVPFDRVFDYVHIKSDGTQEGNTTTQLIERLQEEARQAAAKKAE